MTYSPSRPVANGRTGVGAVSGPSGTRSICFVGSEGLFSDILLRTVDANLAPLRPFRVPDVTGLTRAMQTRDGASADICALVCDEANAATILTPDWDDAGAMALATPAIALENDAFGCTLLATRRAMLVRRRISLLPMNLNLTTWVNLLRLIGSGGHYLPPHLLALEASARTRPAVEPAPDAAPPASLDLLTPRETEVLQLAAEGAPNKLIAHALELSEHTVKLHMHRVMGKLGLHNRTEAAVWYHQHRQPDPA